VIIGVLILVAYIVVFTVVGNWFDRHS